MNNGMKLVILAGLLAVGYGVYQWMGGSSPQLVLANGRKVSGDDIRGPIKAGLTASQVGSEVIFGIHLKDADGQAIRTVVLPGGRQPTARITIVESGGKVLHTGTFRYG